jgi:ElaB/YqjD/DUF883 family membrane-anchored ribosome-binding protein
MFASRSTLEETKNALVKDLQGVVGDADKLLNQVVNSTTEEFAATRSKLESTYTDARHRLHDARIAASNSACHAADLTHKYVAENPWTAVGMIAAVGLIVGILGSRR